MHAREMFAEESWDDDVAAPAAAEPAAGTSDADLEVLLAQCEVRQTAGPTAPSAKPVSKQQAPATAPTNAPTPAAAAAAAAANGVELGYVSPCADAAWLRPEHFPSKVGGAPVWLLPERLPAAERLRCGTCGRSMRFLLQLYCPRPELAHAYHRSLMIF